ncbi:SGNH/GDSL hydrolase family protein [Leisingera sp. S132]|uniref:SGNH/GDSL hydrolase family protein n=1 Tax=Leisingera sp. S132 TaxID=2867016 RepID=UPI0021A48255|nr:SGNH/GDSL hydrolase family protein [Leisingera sp. S132]UWQ80706.1 SGNH/GDSL hydrolase family protein [Leisingera sp. S132]
MTIYLSGGSNTLFQAGWVASFKDKIDPSIKVVNLSIGASTTHMSAFRCMHSANLQTGDLLIWEYGINDANQIDWIGYPEDELVKAFEQILIYCARKEVRFAALIFQPRRRELDAKLTSYRKKLHELCSNYGVPYFDVPQEYAAANQGSRHIPEHLFTDNVHYALNPNLMDFIGAGAAALAVAAAVPQCAPASLSTNQELKVLANFSGGKQGIFENRIVRVHTWEPNDEGLHISFQRHGKLLGIIMTATENGGVFDVSFNGTQFKLTAVADEPGFFATLLRFVYLPLLLGRELPFAPGSELRLQWATDPAGAQPHFGFKVPVSDTALKDREARVVAVLIEEQPQVLVQPKRQGSLASKAKSFSRNLFQTIWR